MGIKSNRKLVIKPVPKPGGSWITVEFRGNYGSPWYPSFEDWYRIIVPICDIEDIKYPNGKGRYFVQEFLSEICEKPTPDWEYLKNKYKIPGE